ncbi:MAG: lysylphosphatidylglycerol synthase domain-containing protein [Gaiellaceae bacterium]
MRRIQRLTGSRRAKIAFNVVSIGIAVVVGTLAAIHFSQEGWPLARASIGGVLGAGALFLLAFGFKAFGWHRLFAPHERPDPMALAAAGGAASVTGIALPGRFDEVVRIAVVRRFGSKTGLGTVGLSLILLGLIDSAALTPMAGVAAGVSTSTGLFRIGLVVVAVAGVAAAGVVLALPRLASVDRLVKYRLVRWLQEHCACNREASKAWVLVSMSWMLRGAALLVLFNALGMHASVPLALAFLCASAAAAALPIAPAGAATQAGAGAAILAATGMSASQAVAFAIAAQALMIVTGAVVVAIAGLWSAGKRFMPSYA